MEVKFKSELGQIIEYLIDILLNQKITEIVECILEEAIQSALVRFYSIAYWGHQRENERERVRALSALGQ